LPTRSTNNDANAFALSNGVNTAALLERPSDSPFRLGINSGSPEPFAFGLRPLKPSTDPFLDHRSFELSEDAHHLEHRLTGRRRGVEALLVQIEVDLGRVQLGQEGDKVLQAAAETIDRPSHDHVELSPRCSPAERIERWALIAALGAADAVILVDLDDLAAHAAGDLAKLALLVGGRLVDGGDAEIENGAFHRG
jgi:hypothetical protein